MKSFCASVSFQTKSTLASFAALAVTAAPLLADTYTFNPPASNSETWTTSGTFTDTTTGTTTGYPNASGAVANVQANITATNTLTLGTGITVGVLNIGDTDGTNSYIVAPGTGGTLTFDNGASDAQINQSATSAGDTISAPISIGGNGDGNLAVSNASSTAVLTLSGGIQGALASGNNTALLVNGTGAILISSAIVDGTTGGQMSVTKSGSGTLTLSAANTFSGGLNMNAGTLILSGASTYSGASTTALTGGTLDINNGSSSTTASALGASALTISGGTIDSTVAGITLGTNNAQTWNGSFAYGGTQSLNMGTGAITLGGNITLTANAANPGTILTEGGAINSTYTLTKAGAGALALTGIVSGSTALSVNAGTLTLSGVNTYTGATALSGGTLNINNASALGTSTLGITGGTIDNTTSATIITTNSETWNGSFAYGGTRSLTLSTGTVTLGGNSTLTTNNLNAGTVLTVNDVIGDGGSGYSLTKQGVGTLALTGANTFSGGLMVNNGTVTLGTTSGAAGTGTITLGGTGSTGGNVSLLLPASAGTSYPVANSIALTSGAVGTITIGAGTPAADTADYATFSGPIMLNGSVLSVEDQDSSFESNQFITGKITLSGAISGAGGLNLGVVLPSQLFTAGTTIISGANGSYTGTTSLLAGQLTIGSATALGTGTLVIGGGVNGTFSGDSLPINPIIDASSGYTLSTNPSEVWNGNFTFQGTNALNLGTGTVSLGTSATPSRLLNVNANTLTVGGIISNGTNATTATTGLIKSGAGTLVLNGVNTYSGGTVVNAGFLTFGAGAVPASGLITINSGGTLNDTGAFATVTGFLPSISTSSTGDIALTGNSSESITFTGYNSLMLGASAAATYTGTITPASTGYHLGGGGATLTLSGVNALTGANNLTIGAVSVVGTPVASLYTSTLGNSSGTVKLSAGNDSLTGATAVNAGTFNLSAASASSFGSLAGSALTVNNGATLAIDSGGTLAPAGAITRASSLTLAGGTFTDAGTSGANSNDVITNALTLDSSANTITVTPSTKSAEVSAASLSIGTNGFALINGVNLGKATTGTAADGNIIFTTAPTSYFVGSTTQTSGGINAGQQNTAIIPELVGTVTSTTGGAGIAGAANTFLTYDTTTGLRPLNLTDEFTNNAITVGNNNYITAATTSGTSASINSLIVAGSTLTITDGTTLTNASGALLLNTSSAAATIAPQTAFTGTLAFGSTPAYIDVNSTANSATISAEVTGSGALIKEGPGQLTLNNGANSFSGGIYVLNGTLATAAGTSTSPTGTTTATPYGSGTIYLGDTGGSNSTALRIGNIPANLTVANPIVVQGGNTGTASLLGGTTTYPYPSFGVTYTGNLTLGSANAAGVVVGHNLTVDPGDSLASVFNLTLSSLIQDPSGLTGPAGVLTLNLDSAYQNNSAIAFGNANSTYSGGTIIGLTSQTETNPVIRFAAGNIFGTGPVTLNNIVVNEGTATTVTGANNQIWNSDWSLNSGTLTWGMTGHIDLGNIASGTTRTLTDSGTLLTIAGAIQNGSNGLTTNLSTIGAITLTGANANTTTTVTSGTLTAGSTTAGTSGGALASTQTATANGTTTLTVPSTTGLEVGQNVSGANIAAGTYITAIGSGTVTLSTAATGSGAGTDTFGAYGTTGVGTTAVSGGTLLLGVSNALYPGETVAVNGTTTAVSTFNLNGLSQTIGALTGSSTPFGLSTFGAIVTNNNTTASNPSTLTISNTAAATYAGAITNNSTNTLSLVKSGTGTQTLSGSNSYTGTTTINNGTLVAAGTFVPATTASLTTASTSSAVVTDATGTAGLVIGERVTGTNITAGSYITAITGPNTFTINNNAAAASTVTDTFAAASSVGNTTSITVSNGGTLLLSSANALGRAATQTAPATAGAAGTATGVPSLSLGGGTGLARTGTGGAGSGTQVGVGMLSLAASSTLDFGTTGVGTINLNSFVPGSFILNVLNDNNTTGLMGTDGTTDRLIFNQNLAVAGTLNDIEFSGVPNSATEVTLSNGEFEIVPSMTAVPEPSTWAADLLALAAGGWYLGRRRRAS